MCVPNVFMVTWFNQDQRKRFCGVLSLSPGNSPTPRFTSSMVVHDVHLYTNLAIKSTYATLAWSIYLLQALKGSFLSSYDPRQEHKHRCFHSSLR